MDTKRIRFGFVCGASTPVTLETLTSLGLRSVESALVDGRQHVLVTVDKSVRASDMLDAVTGLGLGLERFESCEELIIMFEKGQQYLQHPFYILVQRVKLEEASSSSPIPPSAEDAVPSSSRYWQWVSDAAEPVKRKRVIGELASDLVEEVIVPSAPKRAHGIVKKKMFRPQARSHNGRAMHGSGSGHHRCDRHGGAVIKGGHDVKSVPSVVDSTLVSLASEVAKSKDETIAAKNYAIQLLETMLRNASTVPRPLPVAEPSVCCEPAPV